MSLDVISVEFEEEDPDLVTINIKSTSPDRMLRAIQEDEEAAEEGEEEEDVTQRGGGDKRQEHAGVFGDEVFDVVNNNQGLSEDELAILSKISMSNLHIIWICGYGTFCPIYEKRQNIMQFERMVCSFS